jgi:hypothetical protein
MRNGPISKKLQPGLGILVWIKLLALVRTLRGKDT